ncbi:MAG: hypothetical protein CL524_01145 [Aequorivita sp.]|nr:hypothetical protein [Aequorivita sp.]
MSEVKSYVIHPEFADAYRVEIRKCILTRIDSRQTFVGCVHKYAPITSEGFDASRAFEDIFDEVISYEEYQRIAK